MAMYRDMKYTRTNLAKPSHSQTRLDVHQGYKIISPASMHSKCTKLKSSKDLRHFKLMTCSTLGLAKPPVTFHFSGLHRALFLGVLRLSCGVFVEREVWMSHHYRWCYHYLRCHLKKKTTGQKILLELELKAANWLVPTRPAGEIFIYLDI